MRSPLWRGAYQTSSILNRLAGKPQARKYTAIFRVMAAIITVLHDTCLCTLPSTSMESLSSHTIALLWSVFLNCYQFDRWKTCHCCFLPISFAVSGRDILPHGQGPSGSLLLLLSTCSALLHATWSSEIFFLKMRVITIFWTLMAQAQW